MEGKNLSGSPCPPPPPSSSLVADLFGEKKNTPSSASSTLFNSLFLPASSVMGRGTSQPEIFAPLKKYEVGPDDKSHRNGGRGETTLNNKNTIYQNEKADPCLFGSSVYYGDRDICTNTSTSPDTRYNYKTDGEDGLDNSDAALRGNWWQGMREILSKIMALGSYSFITSMSSQDHYIIRLCSSGLCS